MQFHAYDRDQNGIVTLTFDAQGRSANTMSQAWLAEFEGIVTRLSQEQGLTGVVLASAKKTFFAGGDLAELLANDQQPAELFAYLERNKAPLRALERLAVPVVAAIGGAALGGGFEICLACNHRILVDDPRAVVGLPEVGLGLLPGAGGVVRLVALLGLERALPLLMEGRQLKPAEALGAGLVDALAPAGADLVALAKDWIAANPGHAVQPWDQKGFVYPGGNADAPAVRQIAAAAPAMLYARTRGLSPAPEKILDLAVNSMRMGFDSALRAETRGLAALIPTPEARAAISTFFFGMQAIKSGDVRPAGPESRVGRAGVLGAGMMGAGIAWAQASRGIPTYLADTTLDRAAKGKSYSHDLAEKRVARGQMTPADATALLDRITPTDDIGAVRGLDLVIEAVFEDIALKEQVIPQAFASLSEDGILASNTSSLPISILAQACPAPDRFVGLHFFSPVDRMKIVEIIRGAETSVDTLRRAYDYVRQIGYTPIVVNDSRGFFTSRVFGTFMDEGQALLRDGMQPVAIERAAWLAGMPVGPFAVHDEVSMVLTKRVHDTHKALDARLGVTNGFPADDSNTVAVAHHLVAMGRGGRHYGGGFYDYHADGSKTLWPGLQAFAERDLGLDVGAAVERLLMRQAIETLRCLHEGVLETEVEGNLGSILAIGFPSHTGGALQYIHGLGLDRFAQRAADLAQQFGPRFALPDGALARLRPTARKAA